MDALLSFGLIIVSILGIIILLLTIFLLGLFVFLAIKLYKFIKTNKLIAFLSKDLPPLLKLLKVLKK